MAQTSTTYSMRLELLNRDNYDTWKVQAEALLIKNDSWGYVSGSTRYPVKIASEDTATFENRKDAWTKADQKAKADLILSIHPTELSHIRGCDKSKDVWTRLESVYASKGPARKATLLKRLTQTKMAEGDDATKHVTEFFDAVDKLKTMDIDINGDLLTIMHLYSLPSSFDNFRCAIESRDKLPEPDPLKIKILEEFNARKQKGDHTENAALFTRPGANKYKKGQQRPKPKYKCSFCKKEGHKASDCYAKKAADKAKTNTAANTKTDEVHLCFFTEEEAKPPLWCLDSGCTSHLCNRKHAFTHMEPTNTNLKLANNSSTRVEAKGNVDLTIANSNQTITLRNTLYVPNLASNLLSVARIVDQNHQVTFKKDCAIIYDLSGQVKFTAQRIGDLFYVREEEHRACAVSQPKDTPEIWHARLGHLNYGDMFHMLHNGDVIGPNLKRTSQQIKCDICIEGKMTSTPFKRRENISKKPLELVHTDLCGPMRTQSVGGARYFLTFIDDYSRWCHVYFLRTKDQVTNVFVEYKNLVEKQTGCKIKELQSDNGGEFLNKKMSEILKAAGIHQRLTVSHTPQQNGVAERKNRTLVEAARCMLLQSGLPRSFWAEAVSTANYVRNRCTTKAIPNGTPYERWTKQKPDIRHLYAFGEKVYALNKTPDKGKFDARGLPGTFLGYSDNSKALRIWLPEKGKIIVSRDTRFMNEFDPSDNPESGEFLNEEPHHTNQENTPRSEEAATPLHQGKGNEPTPPEKDDAQSNSQEEDLDNSIARGPGRPRLVKTGKRGRPSKVYNTTPRRSARINPPERTAPNDDDLGSPGDESDREDGGACKISYALNATEIPIDDAVRGPDRKEWLEAIYTETKCLVSNDTWKLVERPANTRIIGCRTVLRNKYNPDGTICRRKARIVARGFSQIPGQDFTETFAPVARLESFRLLMALSAKLDLKVTQLDVTTAFLNGDIDTTIYMEQPDLLYQSLQEMSKSEKDKEIAKKATEMMEDLKTGNKVCKLKKALYGLRQAERQWHAKLSETLQKMGLYPTESDPCVYVDKKSKEPTYVLVYVDDILIATRNEKRRSEIVQGLSAAFDVKNLGPVSYCLGIEVKQTEDKITMSQSGYIRDTISKFGMKDCKPAKTPIPLGVDLKLSEERQGEYEDIPYRQLIGALMYVAIGTRPDIAYAVTMMSQFNSKFDQSHWQVAKRVLRYLQGTMSYKLTFTRDDAKITGYTDADWGNCKIDRRSFSGYVFTMSQAAVSWSSKKQRTVALSSTEAEYMALTEAAREALHLSNFVKEIGLKGFSEITIYNDNQSAGKLAQNPMFHGRSKHIDIRHHFIRQVIRENPVELEYMPTEEMTADVLTKPLSGPKTAYCALKMGLKA